MYSLTIFCKGYRQLIIMILAIIWILGHVSLLKLEKYVEDDNHWSVLQIDIVSSRKYWDYTSIASSEYSPTIKEFDYMWKRFHCSKDNPKNIKIYVKWQVSFSCTSTSECVLLHYLVQDLNVKLYLHVQ